MKAGSASTSFAIGPTDTLVRIEPGPGASNATSAGSPSFEEVVQAGVEILLGRCTSSGGFDGAGKHVRCEGEEGHAGQHYCHVLGVIGSVVVATWGDFWYDDL